MLQVGNVIEIKTEHDIQKLIELNLKHFKSDSDKERLERDFSNGYFKGYFFLDSEITNNNYCSANIRSYVILYNSYSSWQNRVLYISELWFKSELTDEEKYKTLECVKETLFALARENNYNRINFNIKNIDENKKLIEWVVSERMGGFNLSAMEDWFLFEMQLESMKSFLNQNIDIKPKFRIVKVTEMNEYCAQIRDLIKEISIFEKMEDQFKTSLDDMVRDYKYENKNRFYEAMVVLSEEDVIGYSLYYMNYDLKRGRGCYLEDLYIQEKYRRNGLGTALWKEVIHDCLLNHKANYMQWTVLAWNTPAIELYYKFKSINLTELFNLNLFRFPTEKIYNL